MTPSQLWSRRMTARHHDVPTLFPLLTKHLGEPACLPSRQSATILSPLSPALHTPTEAANILLGDSPGQAAARTHDAVAACMDMTTIHSLAGRLWLLASPLLREQSDALDSIRAAREKADLRLEIDMAALATEMALQTLDSDSDTTTDNAARWSGRRKCAPRLRLLNGSMSAATIIPPRLVVDPTHSASSLYGDSSSVVLDKGDGVPAWQIDKPVRKGRARMSQEKRRRLARRRERQAMLLGLPPLSSSAPAHQTRFVNVRWPTHGMQPHTVFEPQDHLSHSLHAQLSPQDFLALPDAPVMVRRASAPAPMTKCITIYVPSTADKGPADDQTSCCVSTQPSSPQGFGDTGGMW